MGCLINFLYYSRHEELDWEPELGIYKGMVRYRYNIMARALHLTWTGQDMMRAQPCRDMTMEVVTETLVSEGITTETGQARAPGTALRRQWRVGGSVVGRDRSATRQLRQVVTRWVGELSGETSATTARRRLPCRRLGPAYGLAAERTR